MNTNVISKSFWIYGLLLIFSLHVTAADRPNFLVILCDDLGYGDLACYGHPHIKTPHLDDLARSGIQFSNCYSAAPVCSPSRAGLLTGRSPNRAGIYDWIPPGNRRRPDAREQVHLRASETTLPLLLQKAGYATCLAGKYHCNSQFNQPTQAQPHQLGFDHWFATQNNAQPSHANPNNFVRNGSPVGPLNGYSCQLVADEGIRWMQQRDADDDSQPFFLFVAFHEPHEPIASPEALVNDYREVAESELEADYFANVANLDRAVGRLMKTVDELGERDNTLVFFTSDNGPETLRRYPGATRSFGRPTPLRGMKLWTTEAGFRVPGIASWRGTITPHQTIDSPVSSLDLLPTFLQLADIPLPTNLQLDGADISQLLTGQGGAIRPLPLFWAYYNALNEQRVAMRTEEWKVLATLNEGALPKYQNVFDGNLSDIRDAQLGDIEIYRIESDTSESNNLAARLPSKAAELKQQLELIYRQLVTTSHFWSSDPKTPNKTQ